MGALATFPIAVPVTAIDKLSQPFAKMGGKMGQFGRKAIGVGKNLSLGLTAPVAGLGFLAISTSLDFERGMNRVEALTGAGGQAMEKLTSQAKELGSTTEFSASQAAAGMGFLAQSGMDVLEIQQTLPPVLRLASAAQLDLATTADLATNIMKGYGLETTQAGFATDVLAEATTKGNTDLVQLSEAMKVAGPVGKAMGQRFETVVAVMDKLSDAGFQGQLGGTALKRAMTSLIRPGGAALQVLDRLQINSKDLFDDQGNLRDFIGLIELLQQRGARGTDIMQIFGERAGPAMAALLGQSTEEMRLLVTQLERSGGRAEEIQRIQLQGAVGGVVRLKSAFEGLMISIGESGLLEAFAGLVEKLTSLVNMASRANPMLLKIGVAVATVAAIVGPFIVMLGAFSTGLGVLAPILPIIGGGLAALGGMITGVLMPAVASFFTLLLTNPIGIIIAAVGALIVAGVALAKNWDKVTAALGAAWDFVVGVVKGAVRFVIDKIGALLDFLPDWLVDLLSFSPIGIGARIANAVVGGSDEDERLNTAVATRQEQITRQEGRVRVEFGDLPPGATVTEEGDVDGVDVATGVNLLTA